MTSDAWRRLSAFSVIGSLGVLLVAPLHAVAYLRDDSSEDAAALIPWDDAAYELAPALWDWSSRHAVYVNYGRVMSVLLPLMLVGALVLHRRQRQPERRFERWAFRGFAVGATLLVCGALLEYYTRYLDEAFLFLSLPGLLLTLIFGLLFGIAAARADAVPTWQGVLLAAAFLPGVPVLTALLGHIPLGLSVVAVAFILIGAHLLRQVHEARVGQERTRA